MRYLQVLYPVKSNHSMNIFNLQGLILFSLLLLNFSPSELTAQKQVNTAYYSIETAPLYLVSVGDVELGIRHKKGQGTPVVFIHGSWDDHNSWLPVAEELAGNIPNPSLLYDRRGHSTSTPDTQQGTISMDVQDVLSLLDSLGYDKAHFIGHSYGANIAVELVNSHPERAESIVIYEPPMFGLLKDNPSYKTALREVQLEMQKSKELLQQGAVELGTFNFIEKVAFGKGSWYSIFDERARSTMVASYRTWLDQANDPERLNIRPAKLNEFKGKITLITGSNSIAAYPAVAKELKSKVPQLQLHSIEGAGHAGLVSHAAQTAAIILAHLESF